MKRLTVRPLLELWDSRQGLWNAKLLESIRGVAFLSLIYRPIETLIVLLDTVVLGLRALARRRSLLGVTKLYSRSSVPDGISVIYLDLGTHKRGSELAWMVESILPNVCTTFEVYGFEANPDTFEQVKARFQAAEKVKLLNKAICYRVPSSGMIRLFKDLSGGFGDSLYRKSDSYEEVDAIQLSKWLQDSEITLHDRICLLRMNIEGAEYDVIQDLLDTGLAEEIDGYYGMWDDVSKIDTKLDAKFRTILSQNNIRPFTFNGRDLRWACRKKCIEYDVNTSIQAGLRKLRGDRKKCRTRRTG